MIRIQKLKRPTKRSGFKLEPKAKTTVKGIVIVNTNSFSVHIDKFTTRQRKE